MKRILSLILTVCITVCFCSCSHDAATLHSGNFPDGIRYADTETDFSVSAPQVFVFDMKTGEIIYTKGKESVLYPASTTKLLTALAAMSVLDLSEVVTPTDELELLSENSSIAYVKKHHSLTVEMLIEGMMLPSGNDAAYALAAAAGRRIADDDTISGKEATERFVKYMNEYAKELGMIGSSFTVPDGFAGKETYSTVEDMLILAKAAAENEIIAKYAAMAEDSVVYASGHLNTWKNTNELLDEESKYYSPYAVGLKTGTSELGKSLIVRVSDGDRDYLIGIFSASTDSKRYDSALKIIDKLIY